MQYLKQQIEARQQAWHAAKTLLDAAAAENRDLTGEEEQSLGCSSAHDCAVDGYLSVGHPW